jgi:hypothetical protein
MTDFPDIINTPVVDKKWDKLWDELSGLPINANKVDVLILSLPYRDGSGDEVQLQKMLQACNLTPEQYHIIFINEGELVPWHKFRDTLRPGHILLLGILPEQLGISAMFRLFEPNRFNEVIWIPGLSLAQFEQQTDAKRQLWQNGLKPVFVDKSTGNN